MEKQSKNEHTLKMVLVKHSSTSWLHRKKDTPSNQFFYKCHHLHTYRIFFDDAGFYLWLFKLRIFFMLKSNMLPGNAFRANTASVTFLVCIFEFSNFHIDFLPNLYTYHIIYTSNTFKTFIGLMIIKYFNLYIQYILLIHSIFAVS